MVKDQVPKHPISRRHTWKKEIKGKRDKVRIPLPGRSVACWPRCVQGAAPRRRGGWGFPRPPAVGPAEELPAPARCPACPVGFIVHSIKGANGQQRGSTRPPWPDINRVDLFKRYAGCLGLMGTPIPVSLNEQPLGS